MKSYLIDTFRYNDHANRQVLKKVHQLADTSECVRFFSHLINSQNKWMERIHRNPVADQLSWWDPLYPLSQVEPRWNDSYRMWVSFLEDQSEDALQKEIRFVNSLGMRCGAKVVDIALQLNYHSIHHRAQIQTVIRKQGLEPDFIDYIATVWKQY